MIYIAKYLPVDKPLEDGCDVINYKGERFTYEAGNHFWQVDSIKRAELFLVSTEFNEQRIVGQPSPLAKWLKNGTEVKAVDCQLWSYNNVSKCFIEPRKKANPNSDTVSYYLRIKCPACGDLH